MNYIAENMLTAGILSKRRGSNALLDGSSLRKPIDEDVQSTIDKLKRGLDKSGRGGGLPNHRVVPQH